MEVIAIPVPADGGIKKFGGILGSAGAKAIEAQGILVVFAVFAVLAASVHFAEHQLPVKPLFLFVIVHGAAAPKVLHLHAQVFVAGDNDGIAVPLPCFVNSIGQDFKDCVLAAFQIVRAKNNCRALTHPVFSLQHGDTGIAVLFLLFVAIIPYLP